MYNNCTLTVFVGSIAAVICRFHQILCYTMDNAVLQAAYFYRHLVIAIVISLTLTHDCVQQR